MVPEVFARNAFSLAAFITAFCEALSTFEDEKTFIWRGPMNWAKGIYLMTRYSSLIVSTVNSFTLFYGPLRLYPTQPDHCLYWFSIFSALSVIPVIAIEAFSVTRIFLLYSPDRRVGVLAASLVITEMLLVSISSSDAINSSSFTPECGMTTPRRFFAVLLWLVGTQLLLIGLALYRIRSLFGDRRQGSTVCLVLQQGIVLNVILIVTTAGALIPSLTSGAANLNVIALWPGLICSCAFCRVILHLRRSALLEHDTKNSPEARSTLDIEFTSWLTSPIEDSYSINRSISDSVLVRRRFCPRTNVSNEHSQPENTLQAAPSRPPSHILSPEPLESA